MTREIPKLKQLKQLIELHQPENGIFQSTLDQVILFRESQSKGRVPLVYEPALIIAAQGKKQIFLQDKQFEYNAGQFLVLFTPMAVECQLKNITKQRPMLGLCILLDRHRLARLLLKMEDNKHIPRKSNQVNPSGIFTASINSKVLDAAVRLVSTLGNATEARIIGESIIDEIYYRILNDEQNGALISLLQQHGQIQQIAKAVEFLHKNLSQSVSVESLAKLAGMSVSGFHNKFKQVMHLSPLQYIKLIRLNKAKTYIMEGKNISEAGYLVGYNSAAQFSREYKRQFGIAPSFRLTK